MSGPDAVPHFLHVFPTFGVGGVPIRIANVLNHFGRRYRHTIVALDGAIDARSRLRNDLAVTVVDPGIHKERRVETLLTFARILRTARPQLLLTYNWGSTEWALLNTLLRRGPHIHFESGFGPDESEQQLPRRIAFRRVALWGASRIVVPSSTLFDLATKTWKLRSGRVAYVPNGVDCQRFAAAPDARAIANFRKAPGELIVGTLAPLRAEKNLGRLLRAFAGMPGAINARLLIVGDGPERAGLEALAAELGIAASVTFAGHVEAPERVLGLFDVFAISSDTEQMPNTILQAMAAGLAIAGVDVGDVKPMVGPQNRAMIVAKSDSNAFAAALKRLLTAPGLRETIGHENQVHVRAHYDQARMFAAYGDLFEAAMAGRRARPAPASAQVTRPDDAGRTGAA
jgi:glycosyltransferase involved in cell wall biosynthesis